MLTHSKTRISKEKAASAAAGSRQQLSPSQRGALAGSKKSAAIAAVAAADGFVQPLRAIALKRRIKAGGREAAAAAAEAASSSSAVPMKKRKVVVEGNADGNNMSFYSDVLSLTHSMRSSDGVFTDSGRKKRARTSSASDTSSPFWDAAGGAYSSAMGMGGIMDEETNLLLQKIRKDRDYNQESERKRGVKQSRHNAAGGKQRGGGSAEDRSERELRIAEDNYYRSLELAQSSHSREPGKRKVGRSMKALAESGYLYGGNSIMHYGGGGLVPDDEDEEEDDEDDDEEVDDNEPAAPLKKRVGRPPKGSSMSAMGLGGAEQYAAMAGNAMGLSLPRGAGGLAASASHEPLKLRRKRAASGGTAIEAAAVLASMLEPDDEDGNAAAGAGSIIKRRKGRAGELQIMVPGAAGKYTLPLSSKNLCIRLVLPTFPLDKCDNSGGAGAVRGVAFDATVKGGESHMTNMGPPGQGAASSSSSSRRSTRGNPRGLGNGPLSLSNGPLTMSNLGHFPLESPFGLNSDGRPMFNLNSSRDTILGLGSNMTDSMRFDFDEVVQHFPSPRAGDRLGSSPGRWDAGINSVTSSGSIGSGGIFFPESGYQQQQRIAQSSSSQQHASAIAHGAQLMAGGTARSESAAASSARFGSGGMKSDPGYLGASSSSSAKDKDNVLEKKFKRGTYHYTQLIRHLTTYALASTFLTPLTHALDLP